MVLLLNLQLEITNNIILFLFNRLNGIIVISKKKFYSKGIVNKESLENIRFSTRIGCSATEIRKNNKYLFILPIKNIKYHMKLKFFWKTVKIY